MYSCSALLLHNYLNVGPLFKTGADIAINLLWQMKKMLHIITLLDILIGFKFKTILIYQHMIVENVFVLKGCKTLENNCIIDIVKLVMSNIMFMFYFP